MDDLMGTIGKITKTVKKSSGDFMKTTKLSMSVASEEENLKSLYIDIGKKVHEIYAYGGSLGTFFDEKYAELAECESRLKDLKDQLDIAKGTKTCPACGKAVEKNAEFCQKCGARMDARVEAMPSPELKPSETRPIEPQPTKSPTPEQPGGTKPESGIRCRACGCENERDTKFCLSCGRLLS